MTDVINKLLSKTDKSTGCWVYTGQQTVRYPQVKVKNKRFGIHRWSYIYFYSDIPNGFDVDHLCKNTKCWNPNHLRLLNSIENQKQNWVAELNSKKTHCVNGHEFTKENTYLYANHRRCKTCKRNEKRIRYWKNKEQPCTSA